MTKEQVFRAALEYAQDQNPGKAVVPDHGFVEGVKWAAEQLQAENERLRNAIQYYFSVLDEVTGKTWRDRPDHVQGRMLSAMNPILEK